MQIFRWSNVLMVVSAKTLQSPPIEEWSLRVDMRNHHHFLASERAIILRILCERCHKPKRVLVTSKIFQCLMSFCVHIHKRYISVVWMFCFFVSVIYTLVLTLFISVHIPRCVSDGRGHMLWRPDVCQNVFIWRWENGDQNVFMG